jgi:uncharacterized protein
MNKKLLLTVLTGTALGLGAASAEIFYTTPGLIYSENFDSLNPAFNSGNPHTWTDNTTISGWYTNQTVYYSNSNFTDTSRMYNMRLASDSTNQSLGGVPGGGQPLIAIGARLINDTGSALTSFSLSYVGAQWRNSANAVASTIVVDWNINPGGLGSGTWTSLGSAATFVAPHTGGTAGNLDGTLSANRATLTASVTEGFFWGAGEELWIRWSIANHSGTNHAVSIDNVTFAAIPEPGHLGAFIIGVLALITCWRRGRFPRR